MKDGETIKIVGHSQGAAFAAGIATELAKHAKYGSRIQFVDYLSPHQPADITHPAGIVGRQFSTLTDQVSSAFGMLGGILNNVNGGSRISMINNISVLTLRWFYFGGMGGHMVGTWNNELLRYWENKGVPIIYR